MKRTNNMVIRPTTESRELGLYATNDDYLYTTRIVPVVRNLAKKHTKGVFDADRAIDAFYPIATDAARKYCREFARVEDAPRCSAFQTGSPQRPTWSITSWKTSSTTIFD